MRERGGSNVGQIIVLEKNKRTVQIYRWKNAHERREGVSERERER